jgi:hypothetical protein
VRKEDSSSIFAQGYDEEEEDDSISHHKHEDTSNENLEMKSPDFRR